jgi:membrane-bound lytic murein transglycosylase D
MVSVRLNSRRPAQSALKALLCAPLALFLAGCPSNTPATLPVNATAPAVTAPSIPSPADQLRKNQDAQKIQQLIDQVERAYQSGVSNYRAGRLDAARLDFDFAVDLMLTSKIDIKTNDTLSDEFDRTVDAVNALEMDALKQGNGFSPRVEQSPVEAAGDLTFPSNPELTARLRSELQTTKSDLPLVVNDYVAGYINYFTNNAGGHAHLLRSLERAGKYKDMISRILTEEGVPQDLIYQAVAESGFQPQAFNAKSGAGGMWQFMPFRGAYGLDRNGFFDERFDPEKSSRAYALYMKALYKQFGDWYLVMAAYDWGPGNIQKAVMRTGYADFWELYRRNALPKETKNYVPAMIAAAIMAKNPKQYGLENMTPEPAVLYDTVSTTYAMDLRLVADVTDSTTGNIVALNPSLLRLSTPRDLSFDLHIPKGAKENFQKRLAEIPEDKRDTWRFHVVRAGETIDQVAQIFHVKTHDLAVANELSDSDDVDTGDELVVPVYATASAASAHPQQIHTKRGDTLVTIADRYGVSTEQLRNWNHLSSNAVTAGRTLYVAEPVRLAPSMRARGSRGKRKSRSAGAGKSHTATSKSPGKKATSSKKTKKRR